MKPVCTQCLQLQIYSMDFNVIKYDDDFISLTDFFLHYREKYWKDKVILISYYMKNNIEFVLRGYIIIRTTII